MNDYEINDKRKDKEFKGITFSKFKKTDVKKELLNSLINERIEPACYWSAEYICAGHFVDLWEIIINYFSKYIHLGNPKLPLYIQLRFQNFKEIVNTGFINKELKMRNNKKIRVLFAEIMSVLALSNKKHTLSPVKIGKNDFNLQEITDKLKADNVEYANRIYLKDDPKELFIALNEFAYNLSKFVNNTIQACYWLEWILEFEAECKRNKKPKLVSANRFIANVDSSHKKDIIWMIWEVILLEALNRDKNIKKIIDALLDIFSIRYMPGAKKRRRYILYNAISLLTDNVNFKIPLFIDSEKIENVKDKIDIIYKQIKKNEIKPEMDYLFNNSIIGGEKNLENTVRKLDQINNMLYIPRDK
jgi:hypothetical protein